MGKLRAALRRSQWFAKNSQALASILRSIV
jgi:hypothetical protein